MNIVITGGASGVGEAMTRRLADTGRHRILITYCGSVDAARSLEKEFKGVASMRCDFNDATSIQSLLTHLSTLDLDVLINNAMPGIQIQHFHRMEQAQILASFQSNVFPAVAITQEAIRIFRKKKFGKIITILSAYLINRPPTGLSQYVAEKAYLASMSKSWAVENASFNITSNCVSPSFMRTAMTKNTDERVLADMESKSPLKKLLEPAEVASVVEFLVNATQQINGTNVPINAASDVI